MTCATKVIPGGSHATPAVYPHPRPRPGPRQPAVSKSTCASTTTDPSVTADTLWTVLFYAASRIISLAAACAALREPPPTPPPTMPCWPPCPNYAELQRRLNRALQGDLPQALRRRRQPLAIDLTLIPYHGKPLHHADEIYRSQAKSGTSHFHAYATAYVIRKGQRFTVALTSVGRNDAMPDVVQRLLREAARAGVRPRYLLLDRGFCSVDVIRYLQSARYAFLMPLVLRAARPTTPRGLRAAASSPAASRAVGRGTRMTSATKRKARFRVCIKCRNRRGERGRHGREALVYAYGGSLRPSSYTWVKETYRSRFAIETSYRQMHQARIRTCTRDPLLRLLYVGMALLLRNVWVWLHWQVLAQSSAWWSADRFGAIEFSQDAGVVATLGRSPFGSPR